MSAHSANAQLVGDAAAMLRKFAEGAEYQELPGFDSNSASWLCDGNLVIKCSRISPFRARLRQRTLEAVHGTLGPRGITPVLHALTYDPVKQLLSAVFSWHAPVAEPTVPEVGSVLGEAHRALKGLGENATFPWIGYYGTYFEFSAVLPGVEDADLREAGYALLPHCRRADEAAEFQLVHRDLHQGNVVKAADRVRLLDWDMAHLGRADDDLAMTVCCILANTAPNLLMNEAEILIAAYRSETGSDWADLSHPRLRTAIALSGLRQGISGWYADEGDLSAPYWPRIRRRMRAAEILLAG